jgi:hypothetical protein
MKAVCNIVAVSIVAGFALCAAPASAHAGHKAPAPHVAVATPTAKANFFYVQIYDIKEGQHDAFKDWFQTTGGPALMAFPGVASVETFVDDISQGPEYITMIGFTDYAAYDRWDRDPQMAKILEPLDSMVGPHKHYLFPYNPLHRAAIFSMTP